VEQKYEPPNDAVDGGFEHEWDHRIIPSSCAGPTDYSTRFTRDVFFPSSATWRFIVSADDGVRLRVDGQTLIEEWRHPQVLNGVTTEVFLGQGTHRVEIDHYQAAGNSTLKLRWEEVSTQRPPAPTNLNATAGTRQVGLTWTAPSGASVTSYNVKRRTPPDASHGQVSCDFSGAESCTDRGVSAGTNYCYVVTAVNGGGESDPSNESCATPTGGPGPLPPPPPTNLTADASSGQVSLGWQAPNDPGVSSYNVRRRTPPDQSFSPISCDFSDAVHCADRNVAEDTTYCYVVTAVNSAGESGASNEACDTTPGDPGPVRPSAPRNLTATGSGSSSVQLGWDAPDDPSVTGYSVKRRTPPDLSYTPIACDFTDDVHCRDGNVAEETTYCYVVTAVNAAGESDPSNEDCATTAAAPRPRLELSVTDAAGVAVASGRTLGLTADGWPTPNGLVVNVTLSCPAEFTAGCHGDSLFLTLGSSAQAARFWIESRGEPSCRGLETLTTSDYAITETAWLCNNAPAPVPGVDLGPGESRRYSWALMVQPVAAADQLNMGATWGAATGSHSLGTPGTQIHPVIVIPGILGTMPPSDVIGQLDPVLGVYNAMLTQLQKMGYVMNETLFPMPYDWRRSNRLSAGHLRNRLDSVFSAISGRPNVVRDGKVDLVVHSMGGIITRTYVEDQAVDDLGRAMPYRNDIRKVVFMSTPHRGFPEDYRTYEGVTWDMFLYDDPLALLAMDNVFWPAFVEKRWRQRHTVWLDYVPFPVGHPFGGRVMCMFGPFDCSGFFSPTLEYRMTHDGVGGTDSMREMLPTDDADPFFGPYLCHDAAGGACAAGPYPFGKQPNTFMNPPAGLNSPAGLSMLETRLGPANIYVIYGRDPDPARPQDRVDVAYDVDPPIPLLGTNLYQNGVPRLAFRDAAGDDLIPTYSMDLKLLLPSIPADNVVGTPGPGGKVFGLPGDAARHKQIMYNPDVLRFWLPRYLAGLDRLAIATEHVKPIFLVDPHQWWTLAALCPVNLTVTDPQGRRAGFNPETGGVFNEIPGAVYAAPNSPDGQFILLPDPVGGDYQITAAGFESDSFSLVLSQVTGKGVFRRWSAGGTTQPGQLDQFTVSFDPAQPDVQNPPVANAGPDQSVQAGPDCMAAVTLDGSASSDLDGEDLTSIWTGPFGAVVGTSPTVTLAAGTHTLTLFVQDGQRSAATDTVVVTVRPPAPKIESLEASPSVLSPPDGKLAEVEVEAKVKTTCATGATCRIVSIKSDEPAGDEADWKITGPMTAKLRRERAKGGNGRVYTLTVECRFGDGPAARDTVKVKVPPAGRMVGSGELEEDDDEYEYSFDVSESERGVDKGRLSLEIEREDHDCKDDGCRRRGHDRCRRKDELRSTEITSVTFSDDSDLEPGRNLKVDTVRFKGEGRWNGKDGYTFEATATDGGEPGRDRDRFKVTVRDRRGKKVAEASGKIEEGNNDSKPAPR
jgi:hypothetical protein